jgi:hypothetical protein
MLNYTEALAGLMRDVTARVPALSFIDLSQVLVFARFGRAEADGPYATCHSLNLPTSEPGYFFWQDPATGEVTRRSEWFVTKSPTVQVRGARVAYLVSVALPRFCEQTLERASKQDRYPGGEPWLAKLDTVVHELFHIAPEDTGIRRVARGDGEAAARSHSPEFFAQVATMVEAYLASRPDREVYEFLRHGFPTLRRRYGEVVATTFRQFPSFPQRYHERLCTQPDGPGAAVVPLSGRRRPGHFTEDDLTLRAFTERGTRLIAPTSRPR